MPYTEFINEQANQIVRIRVVKTMASGNVHIYIAGPDEDDSRYTTLKYGEPNLVEWELSEF